jgi:[acyl-carrier-protein] S-malonyltransferase
MLLDVSAPFHCALMQPAADKMAEALGTVEMRAPAVPLVANVTAGPVDDPETIRKLLVEQVTGMVRWRESVAWLADNGVTSVVEVGSGKVLSGLAKRISKELTAANVGAPGDVEAFLASL